MGLKCCASVGNMQNYLGISINFKFFTINTHLFMLTKYSPNKLNTKFDTEYLACL